MATKNMQPIKLCENIDAMTDDQRAEMFTNGTHADMLEALRLMVDSATFDMDQKKDRETLRTFASQIAKVKTKVDNIGKDIVADWKEKAKRVDMVRKEIRDECDALKQKARKPLTDWESAEAARIEAREAIIGRIKQAKFYATEGIFYGMAKQSSDFQKVIESLESVFQEQASIVDEFTETIQACYADAHAALEQTLEKVIEYEKQQEAERIAMQEQAEREKQLADQLAAEKAERERIQAEQQAEIERLKAELAAKNAPEPESEPEQVQQSAQHEEIEGQLDLLSMPKLVNAEDIAPPANADKSLNSKNKSMHVQLMLEGLRACSMSIAHLIQSDLLDDVERHKITIASNRINQAQVLLAECI